MKKILMLTTAVFLSTSALATETTSADTYLSVMGGYTRTDADLEIYGYKLIGDKFNTATLTVEAGKKIDARVRIFTGKAVSGKVSVRVKNIFDAFQNDIDRGAFRDSVYIYGPMMPRTYFLGIKLSM